MTDNLYKVFEIENELTDIILKDNNDELEIEKIVSKLKRILSKLNNREILYILKNGSSIHEVIDVLDYLKKYKIDKKELENEKSYKDELIKLNNFIELINDSAYNEQEYYYVCEKCDIDNVASYLLSKMNNEDIMNLSNESDDWNYKLFLYGNLKV